MDAAAIYRTEAEIGLLPLKNGPRISGVTYSLCLKPYTGLDLPKTTTTTTTAKEKCNPMHISIGNKIIMLIGIIIKA